MKKWKKVTLGVGGLVVLIGVVTASVRISGKDVVTVQTGKVAKQDLDQLVTASGEIKPLLSVNVSATAYGRITNLHVKEGDKVKKGAMLAQLEAVQPTAEVDAQKAMITTAELEVTAQEAGVKSAEAAYRTALADQGRTKAELERARLDYQRSEGLFKDELIAKSQYDSAKATYEVAQASAQQAEARAQQSRAQWEQAQQTLRTTRARIKQFEATLEGVNDRLAKTILRAPIDGTITNLPVRGGEYMVVGFQNSPGSLLMTISDMSVITAEVKVDETDIVNIRLGQPAEVKIDAIPDKVFPAKVTEVGNTAIIRSSGLATSQVTSGSQEAKDFKVVVTLTNPPENLRPGLSSTAKINTASKKGVLAIPIQSLTIRQKSDLEEQKEGDKKSGTAQAATTPAAAPGAAAKDKNEKKELQGVFVVRNGKAEFAEVDTGITGVTDIEVLKGLKENDEIITGSYRVLRTLKNNAKVKVDNKAVKKEDEKA
jgi:HlyD family secretion protein